jgi:SAM-dependent methyltransferase
LLANRTVSCAHDECAATFPAFDGAPPAWSVVLVNRSCETNGGSVYHLDAPTTAEKRQPARQKAPAALSERIPEGEETSLLRRAGFNKWSDVFPTRQLSVMLETAHAIAELNTSETIRQRLRLALCGTAEMAGYLSRWDRYYPKAFEATANHRFPALGFSCETNLLAARGRGTLRRRLAHSVAAARWADTHLAVGGSVRTAVTTEKRRPLGAGALLARGSAERQLLPDQSVDLVLTDPPYFDDVQYAELASIFLAVARAFELVPAAVSLDLRSEAVANQHRGTGVEDYRTLLTKIFAEARRTLRPNGRIVLTFHNTDIRAWWALARALREAELRVCALAVAEAENATDHAKRGSNAFTSDLVIECRRTAKTSGEVDVVDCCDTAETRELLAAGQTLNEGGRDDLPTFTARYKRLCGTVDNPRIRLSRTESM